MTRFPAEHRRGESGVRRPNSRLRGASRTRGEVVRSGAAAVRSIARLIEVGIAAGIRRELLMEAAGVKEDDLLDPDTHLPLTAEIALWQALSSHISIPASVFRLERRSVFAKWVSSDTWRASAPRCATRCAASSDTAACSPRRWSSNFRRDGVRSASP